MNRRYFLSDTWQGALFGSLLLGVGWGLFVGPQLISVLEHALPDPGWGIIGGISGGLVGVLIGLSARIVRPYWDWADRVMGKLFRRSGGCGERE